MFHSLPCEWFQCLEGEPTTTSSTRAQSTLDVDLSIKSKFSRVRHALFATAPHLMERSQRCARACMCYCKWWHVSLRFAAAGWRSRQPPRKEKPHVCGKGCLECEKDRSEWPSRQSAVAPERLLPCGLCMRARAWQAARPGHSSAHPRRASILAGEVAASNRSEPAQIWSKPANIRGWSMPVLPGGNKVQLKALVFPAMASVPAMPAVATSRSNTARNWRHLI